MPGGNRKNKFNTSLSLDEDDVERIARLKKQLRMTQNQVVSISIRLLEQLMDAQRIGKKVRIAEEQILFFIPGELVQGGGGTGGAGGPGSGSKR